MGVGVHLLLIFLIAVIDISSCQQVWGDPLFTDEGIHEDVTFDGLGPSRQLIKMDEEIKPEYVIAKINYKPKDATDIPRIGLFQENSNPLYLGAKLEKHEDDYYYIHITEKQDYEQPDMRRYVFDIEITGYKKATIYLNIINIDDNFPLIEVTPCTIPELQTKPSDCFFKVSDVDGPISINEMKFEISGNSELNLFDIQITDKQTHSMTIQLVTIENLDFYENQLHIFTLFATDSGPNRSNSSVIVKVKDMPNRPPEWRKVHAVLEFEEKELNTFNVSAVDGDTEINEKILYRFDEKYANYFEVDAETGVVTVKPIDRDEEEKEIFEYELIAYKETNYSWTTPTNGIIYIKDKNDQTPDFNFLEFTTEIEEEKYLNFDFGYPIICHDKDLGDNAKYTVELKTYPEKLINAFQVVPAAGYQKQEFKLVISNASLLDFDDTSFDDITVEIISTEDVEKPHTNKTTITIKLLNWNDEVPIFDPPDYAVEILETVGAGHFITRVICSDRDIGDKLIYSISGNPQSFLDIDEYGKITVKVDGAFDYHRQNEIYVQVLATDTLGDGPKHTSRAELIIKLSDANNRPPQIVMPRTVISVAENVPEGYIIPDALIQGSDLDTTANLAFSINWDASYATKPGKKIDNSTFIGCVDILTEPGDGHGKVIGKLVVKEIKENQTIDYEAFEIIHLSIRLTDSGQLEGINYTEAILPITIEDVNDNPPVWVEGTLDIIRIVRELSESEVVIGNVRATDIDGPEFNVVRYMIEPTEERFEDLVMIDEDGQLMVNKTRAIDADVPPTTHLEYYIYATDCKENQLPSEICFTTSEEIIKINITDTNNRIPYALEEEFEPEASIDEHSDINTHIMTIKSHDLDRDEPFHNVSYSIDFRLQSEIRNLFKIEEHTGRLLVDGDLERDKGTTFHEIEITLTDNNYGASVSDTNKNQNTTTVRVVLIDINDNPPLFVEEYEWEISENTKEGVALSPTVIAEDIDEGENALVKYSMTLTPVDPEKPDFETFLIMDSSDNVSGIISTTKNLKGFWGTYDIFILAYDLGKDPQSSNGTFKLTVNPFNYEEPKFSFPTEGTTLRLHKELAQVGQTLKYTNQKDLENFVAIDPDGKEAGVIDFTITGSETAMDHLDIIRINDKECKLILKKPLETISTFEVMLLATDNGIDPHPKNSTINFTVRFIPMNGEPYFNKTEAAGNFTEFEKGMEEHIPLQPAHNPKSEACTFADCEIETIYYYFRDEPMKDLFTLDPVEDNIMKLRLKKPLNRTEAESYTVRIITSYRSDPTIISPDFNAILTVDIAVKDHDPRPVFKNPLYVAGVGNSINTDTIVLQVEATHTEDLTMTYKITKIETTHSSIANLKDSFILDSKTGELKIKFQPADYMMGKFIIDIMAEDEIGETGETQVNVFLIALDNKVYFTFSNSPEFIGEKRETIERIFTEVFGYKCNTDNIASIEQSNDKTEMVTYFVDADSLPLDAIIIDTKKNDPRLMEKLNTDLLSEDITLEGFGSNRGNASETSEEMLKIILIVVTTVLGILCIMLLITYCVQTKGLKNQLSKLTEKSFTPRPSDANGFGSRKLVPVPGTNIHAIEGSNPVFNEVGRSLNFDTLSETGSGDSELIGIEDNPQFYYGDKY